MKQMKSKFHNTCKACGDTIYPGDEIAHLRKGHAEHIECYRARTAANPSNDTITPTVPTGTSQVDDWSTALGWNETAPEPGASIGNTTQDNATIGINVQRVPAKCDNIPPSIQNGPESNDNGPATGACDRCETIAELSHNDTTGTALCADCNTAVDAVVAGRDEFDSLMNNVVQFADRDNNDQPDDVITPTLEQCEIDTILAALRFYQHCGMGDPVNRPVWLHDIAANNDTSLDDNGIDKLCETINCVPFTNRKNA